MIYGYARVSTASQYRDGNSLDDQRKHLLEFGCQVITEESCSGKDLNRPELQRLLSELKPGDTLVICKLDRFARTVVDGVQTIQTLLDRGVTVHILNMGRLDNTVTGKLILTIMLAFAEFERAQIIERTQTGKSIARQDPGYHEGRPPKYKKAQIIHALELLDKGKTYRQVEELTGISKSTLIRARRRQKPP